MIEVTYAPACTTKGGTVEVYPDWDSAYKAVLDTHDAEIFEQGIEGERLEYQQALRNATFTLANGVYVGTRYATLTLIQDGQA
jgi:hypothetical protein